MVVVLGAILVHVVVPDGTTLPQTVTPLGPNSQDAFTPVTGTVIPVPAVTVTEPTVAVDDKPVTFAMIFGTAVAVPVSYTHLTLPTKRIV